MLKLWLVYDAERRARNAWMIEHYITTGRTMGIEISLLDDTLPLPEEDADAAIIRCVAPGFREACRVRGIHTHNPDLVAEVTNDKWSTFEYFAPRGVPLLDTVPIEAQAAPLAFPFVAKPVDGHGGRGVELIDNAGQWARYSSISEKLVAQEVGDTPGTDLRVYVLGGEILAGMLRESKGELRSNFSLGGAARRIELGAAERAVVDQVLDAMPELRRGFVGIDLMPHRGGWVLNEIEDIVGTRMLYTHTEIDVVPMHLALIADSLGRSPRS